MQGWYHFSISTCSDALESCLFFWLNHYTGSNMFSNLSQMTPRPSLGSPISRIQLPILHFWSAQFISKFVTAPTPTWKCMWFTSAIVTRGAGLSVQVVKPILNSIRSRIGSHRTPLQPLCMGLLFPTSNFLSVSQFSSLSSFEWELHWFYLVFFSPKTWKCRYFMAMLSFVSYVVVISWKTCYQVCLTTPVFHKEMLIGITYALFFPFFMDCIPYQPFPRLCLGSMPR